MTERSTESYQTVDAFLQKTEQRPEEKDRFELENPYLLEVNLDGRVRARVGTMIAYTGNVSFDREGMFEHGLAKALKKAVTGEGAPLMTAEGRGRVYLADQGKKIQVLRLQGEEVCVNGEDLLAMEDSVQWDITMMHRISGWLSGGLFNVRLSGHGRIAITTHGDPLTLRVTADQPICTDPEATVAWSGQLSPDIETNISWKTFLGRGSQEAIQLRFQGEGWVVLQPWEETGTKSSKSQR